MAACSERRHESLMRAVTFFSRSLICSSGCGDAGLVSTVDIDPKAEDIVGQICMGRE